MPAGRPTKYSKSVNKKVLTLMAQGCGREEVAAELGVARRTLHGWAEKHEEFLHTLKVGDELRHSWWLKLERAHATGKVKGSAAVLIFALKSQFGRREQPEEMLDEAALKEKFQQWVSEMQNDVGD